MASITKESQSPAAETSRAYVVTVEGYDIKPKLSAKQKLSPLDMNMPRLYGARWILCFPLPADVDKEQV